MKQLREAFPWDDAPRYLVHDRDTAFHAWATTARAIGINEVITAARSPWQNAYAERLIGPIRRECLDHVIIANERGLPDHGHAKRPNFPQPLIGNDGSMLDAVGARACATGTRALSRGRLGPGGC